MKIEKNIYLFMLAFCLLFAIDLSAQQGDVEVNQDAQIDKLLELKKDINRREKNFKIQIYNGSRTGAENARRKFQESFFNMQTFIKRLNCCFNSTRCPRIYALLSIEFVSEDII